MAGRQAGMSYMHTNKQIYRIERKCLNLKFVCMCVCVCMIQCSIRMEYSLDAMDVFGWIKKKYKKCMFGNYRKLYSSSKNKNKKNIPTAILNGLFFFNG